MRANGGDALKTMTVGAPNFSLRACGASDRILSFQTKKRAIKKYLMAANALSMLALSVTSAGKWANFAPKAVSLSVAVLAARLFCQREKSRNNKTVGPDSAVRVIIATVKPAPANAEHSDDPKPGPAPTIAQILDIFKSVCGSSRFNVRTIRQCRQR